MRKKSLMAFMLAVALALPVYTGCSGGSGVDSKYQQALEKINPKWHVYEVKNDGPRTFIRVEVSDNVPFADGKKAEEALHKIDPKMEGFVEFYNKDVGIVLRKVELVPAT